MDDVGQHQRQDQTQAPKYHPLRSIAHITLLPEGDQYLCQLYAATES
jgi:hypothetical protein